MNHGICTVTHIDDYSCDSSSSKEFNNAQTDLLAFPANTARLLSCLIHAGK